MICSLNHQELVEGSRALWLERTEPPRGLDGQPLLERPLVDAGSGRFFELANCLGVRSDGSPCGVTISRWLEPELVPQHRRALAVVVP